MIVKNITHLRTNCLSMLNTVSHSHFDFLPQSFELQDSNYAIIKRYRRGHGFKSRTGLKFFSGPTYNYSFQ